MKTAASAASLRLRLPKIIIPKHPYQTAQNLVQKSLFIIWLPKIINVFTKFSNKK